MRSKGFLNLADVPVIRLVGGGQFRKGQFSLHRAPSLLLNNLLVCIVALALLVLTVWLTCWTQEEDERKSEFGERKS
jgi:solute carrier family 45 protein 1/2/4